MKLPFSYLVVLTVIHCLYFSQTLFGQKTNVSKPNFIIIFTDDQGYNDLGCYGSELIKTPNIDQLAEEGVKLTSFYAQPVCGPSRAALLTGSYPLRIAEIDNQKRMHPFVHPNEVLLPELLKTKGYESACIGKWDINGHGAGFPEDRFYPTEMGFDYYFGVPSSNDGGIKNVHRNKENLGDFSLDTITQMYTTEALSFIEKNKSNSFFLYLAHSMPHTKLGAGKQFKGKSSAGLYGDAIEEIDWGVGEIKKLLEKLKLDKNTIIIYTSDNGPWQVRGTHAGSAYPLRNGKTSTWEGGVRVPCVMWGDGLLKKGFVSDKVTSTMDVFSTIANIAGCNLPSDRIIDGKDISSLILKGSKDVELEELYFYYFDTHLQGVRFGDWKLVAPRPQAPEWLTVGSRSVWKLLDTEPVRTFELYNLKLDISERRDIAAQYPDKVEELKALLDWARNDIGDYNKIGENARFFESEEKRRAAKKWKEKELSGWKQEIKVNKFYDDGARDFKY